MLTVFPHITDAIVTVVQILEKLSAFHSSRRFLKAVRWAVPSSSRQSIFWALMCMSLSSNIS